LNIYFSKLQLFSFKLYSLAGRTHCTGIQKNHFLSACFSIISQSWPDILHSRCTHMQISNICTCPVITYSTLSLYSTRHTRYGTQPNYPSLYSTESSLYSSQRSLFSTKHSLESTQPSLFAPTLPGHLPTFPLLYPPIPVLHETSLYSTKSSQYFT
jgi:hypothetical protein